VFHRKQMANEYLLSQPHSNVFFELLPCRFRSARFTAGMIAAACYPAKTRQAEPPAGHSSTGSTGGTEARAKV
jgi:hypothetical protein